MYIYILFLHAEGGIQSLILGTHSSLLYHFLVKDATYLTELSMAQVLSWLTLPPPIPSQKLPPISLFFPILYPTLLMPLLLPSKHSKITFYSFKYRTFNTHGFRLRI